MTAETTDGITARTPHDDIDSNPDRNDHPSR